MQSKTASNLFNNVCQTGRTLPSATQDGQHWYRAGNPPGHGVHHCYLYAFHHLRFGRATTGAGAGSFSCICSCIRDSIRASIIHLFGDLLYWLVE